MPDDPEKKKEYLTDWDDPEWIVNPPSRACGSERDQFFGGYSKQYQFVSRQALQARHFSIHMQYREEQPECRRQHTEKH
jgi:hypothetical protein